MKKRCPKAKILGKTEILDYILVFRGEKERAVATIEPRVGKRVPALLWEISETDEVALNHYEGYPFLYGKECFMVLFQGKLVESMVYIMNEGEVESTPHPYYYYCIEESYKMAGFSQENLEYALKQSENTLNMRQTQDGFYLKRMESEEMDATIEIADKQLGEGYFTKEELSLVFTKKENYFGHVMVDLKKNNRVIAFSYEKIITSHQFSEDLRLPLCGLPSFVRIEPRVAVVKTVCVSEGYQGQGIGRRLVGEVTEKLLKKEKNVACIAWKKGEIQSSDPEILKNNGRTNIGTVLQQNQFQVLLERPDFWMKESLEKGCGCPHCGEVCRCSAEIYLRRGK